MDKVEVEVRKQLGDGDVVEHGLHRLETLLESQVDIRFDQYEAYLLRNIFDQSLDPALLPFLRLAHHPSDGFAPPAANGAAVAPRDDAALLSEWADEREKADEAERSYKDARAASQRVERRLAALDRMLEQLDLSPTDANANRAKLPAPDDARRAAEALAKLRTASSRLLATPAPPPLPVTVDKPWDRREGFIAWATARKLAALDLSDRSARSDEPAGTEDDLKVRAVGCLNPR